MSNSIAATSAHQSSSTIPPTKANPVVESVDLDVNLYHVAGGLPPLHFTRDFKSVENRNLKVSKWKWQELKQPARKDALKLYHWARLEESIPNPAQENVDNPAINTTTEAPSEDNPIPASVITPQDIPDSTDKSIIGIPNFSDEEYDLHLRDSAWTREETRYLFDLCREFDLRFFIIKDRYEFGTTSRTLEDLKDRYYTVCRVLMAVRLPPGTTETKAEIAKYHFDKTREIERKRHLAKLYSRTRAQIQEEELLYFELRKRELRDAKYNKERELSLHAHSDHELLHRSAAAAAAAMGSNDLKKKRKSFKPDDNNSIAGSSRQGSGIMGPPAAPASNFKSGRKKVSISTSDLPRGSISGDSSLNRKDNKSLQSGVIVRSSTLGIVKATLQASYYAALQEFGIPLRPAMMTANVVMKHEELRKNLVHLLELRRSKERLEQNIKILESGGVLPPTAGNRRRTLMNESVSPVLATSPVTPESSTSATHHRKRSLAADHPQTPRDAKRSRG